jgi:hypothetical protein
MMVTRSKAHSVHLAERRQMTAEERRQQIIDKSAALFDSGPLQVTSMDDIAAAVGVATDAIITSIARAKFSSRSTTSLSSVFCHGIAASVRAPRVSSCWPS